MAVDGIGYDELRSVHLDLASLPCLSSTGNDSHVYRLGDQVVKVYHTLSLDEVARYAELQNAAADILAREPYAAEFAIKGVPHRVVVSEVVRVDEIAVSDSGRPVAFARYVPAPNLEKLLYRPDRFERFAREQLADPALREFAHAMNALFWDEYPTRVRDEFVYHICMLSRRLDRELGVRGLYISRYNVKLRPVPGEARIDVIVTDLALYVDRVTEGAA